MPTGIPKNGTNKGWFKKGEHYSLKTEFKKGQKPIAPFKKGQIPWNKKEGITIKCLICKKDFKVIPARKDMAKYCSQVCLNKSNRKYKHTEEAKIKISKAQIGKTIDTKIRKKMSKAGFLKWQNEEYRNKFTGKNHFNWQNGKSFEPYGLEFNNNLKKTIRNRDEQKCQICGKTKLENNEELSIHHIDYDKRNNNLNNLISLCRDCHIRTNYKRKYWTKFFRKDYGQLSN